MHFINYDKCIGLEHNRKLKLKLISQIRLIDHFNSEANKHLKN